MTSRSTLAAITAALLLAPVSTATAQPQDSDGNRQHRACEALQERADERSREARRSNPSPECEREDDLDAPELVSSSATPETIAGGDTVTLEWHLTDETGVAFTTFFIRNADNGQYVPGSSTCRAGNSVELASGTPQDGTYQTTCTIPSGANSGTYEIQLSATDEAGNELHTTGATFTVS